MRPSDPGTDESIATRLSQGGGAHLFETLYDRYASKVYFKCLSILKKESDAQDACHDVFLKVFLKMSDYDGRAKFGTWIYTITYNHCIDVLRKAKKWKMENVEGMEEEEGEDRGEEALLEMKVRELKWVLEHLPPTETALLLMKYQDEMSIQDISSQLEIGSSAVKMRLKRAREHAHTLYQDRINKMN